METTIMENQMEKKMENEMEYIGVILGLYFLRQRGLVANEPGDLHHDFAGLRPADMLKRAGCGLSPTLT